MKIIHVGPERPFSEISQGTLDECSRWLSGISVVGLDTETSGLDFTKEKAILLQLGNEDVQYCIDLRYVDITPLKEHLQSPTLLKIGHNIKFDYKFLLNLGVRLENVWDTMLAEMVLHCGRQQSGFGLKDVALKYTGTVLNKDERNLFIGMHGQPFTDRQLTYGAKDVTELIPIMLKQKEELEKESLLPVAQLENRATLAFGDIEYNGLDIDPAQWLSISSEEGVRFKELEKELDETIFTDPLFKAVVPEYIQGDLFGTPRKVSTSWDSPKQVLKVMQCIVPELQSVDANDLFPVRGRHPLIKKYLEYKEIGKIISTYGQALLDTRLHDKKIHTTFKQVLSTGRVSSKEPNMQNIKAENRFRNCFKAPPGYVFVSSDFSSQELVTIAFGSQDPVWLAALNAGEDLHSKCAAFIYGPLWKDYAATDCEYYISGQKCNCKKHKELRNNVKSLNFGLAYGMGSGSLAARLEISKDEAKKLISDYFRAFPKIKVFLDSLKQEALDKGYAMTYAPFKRKRFFPGWYRSIGLKEPERAGEIGRAGTNLPIQGSSADMTKLAMILVRNVINAHSLPVKLVMQVHD